MEKDFWSYFNQITGELVTMEKPEPKDFDEKKLSFLFDQKIEFIKRKILKNKEAGQIYLWDNWLTATNEYNSLEYYKNTNPNNGSLASLHIFVQSFCDSLLRILQLYSPDVIIEANLKPQAEKYCSVQIYNSLFVEEPEQVEQRTPENQSQQQPLSVDKIALVCFYEGQRITRENCRDVFKRYGHEAQKPNSGEKLYQRYIYYSDKLNRTGEPPETAQMQRTIKNKVKLFESVIKLLTKKAKPQAEKDYKQLETIYKERYL